MRSYLVTIGMTHFYSVRVKSKSEEEARIKGAVYIKRNHKEMVSNNKKAQITQIDVKPARRYSNEKDFEVSPVSHKKKRE